MGQIKIHIAIFTFISASVYGQNQTFNTTINKAEKVNFYTNVNTKNKDKILLVNKYIDTLKPIIIRCGPTAKPGMSRLRTGYTPFTLAGDSSLLNLKIKNGQLLISMMVFGFDRKYVGKIKDNKLIPAVKNYQQYASDRFIEIYDEYNIPVLQIDLNKEDNSIRIGGLFFNSQSFLILSGNTLVLHSYEKPFLLLSQPDRDSLINLANTEARQLLKPLHE